MNNNGNGQNQDAWRREWNLWELNGEFGGQFQEGAGGGGPMMVRENGGAAGGAHQEGGPMMVRENGGAAGGAHQEGGPMMARENGGAAGGAHQEGPVFEIDLDALPMPPVGFIEDAPAMMPPQQNGAGAGAHQGDAPAMMPPQQNGAGAGAHQGAIRVYWCAYDPACHFTGNSLIAMMTHYRRHGIGNPEEMEILMAATNAQEE
ncbi:unnamed protein product [Caenorhabditis brenneri]